MKKRRLLLLVPALALVVAGISACGNSGGGSSSSSSSSESVDLSVFQFKVETKDAFNRLAEAFHADNPNININIETVGGGNDYGAALKTKFSSGNEPSIFNIGGPEDVQTWNAKLDDVSGTEAAKQALDGTLDAVTQDGKVLGVPYNIEGNGIMYNTDIFQKAGIDASTITSLDALEQACETLQSKASDLGIDAPIAFAAKEAWQTGLHMSNSFLAPEFDNDVNKAYASKTVAFKLSDSFKRFIDIENKYSTESPNSVDMSTQMENYFANGKVAMSHGGNWAYPTVAGANQDMAENNLSMFPIPVDQSTAGKLAVGVPMYWAVNKDKSQAERDAAKKFLDYMYTTDKGKDAVLTDMKFVPAYKGYDESKISDPLSKIVYKAKSDNQSTGWVFMGYPADWGQNVLGASIQKYIQGSPTQSSWDSIINAAKASWKKSRASS
jgi:raffinose/stachyose/melibiose transport system substrate-binding protein